MSVIIRGLISALTFLYRSPSEGFRSILRKLIGRLDGGQAFSLRLREIMRNYHGIEIGIGTYGPCFELRQTWVGEGNLTIGKYCSIARDVCIYSRNHPYWNPSMSPLFYNASFQGVDKDTVAYQRLDIGNDVWIGQYALILPSCRRIGNGAVVGAGAIVTKDIPAYSIVAGNPAKVIKYRFDKETIEWLEELRWWDWETNELRKASPSFQSIEKLREYARQRDGKLSRNDN